MVKTTWGKQGTSSLAALVKRYSIAINESSAFTMLNARLLMVLHCIVLHYTWMYLVALESPL
jgi:hypothetical protein